MTNPLVSIIIPVYNVEEYLAEAVDSALGQTYNNTEIILINDGSTDSSGEIARNYQKRYPGKIKLIEQSNQGLSGARNSGINASCGEYVTFLDSDDMLHKNAVEYMVKAAQKLGVDIVISGFSKKNNKGRLNPEKIYTKASTEVLERVLYQTIFFTHSAWGKLYSANILKNELFVPGLLYEDLEFFPRVLAKTDKVGILPGESYYYRQNRRGSILNVWDSRRTDVLEIAGQLVGAATSEEIRKAALCRQFAANFNIYNVTPDKCLKERCRKKMKELARMVLTNRKARIKDRIGAFIAGLM